MSATAPPNTNPKPTNETYGRFQLAYDVFNKQLFGAGLPDCLITLQRRKRSYGYFCGDRFGRADGRLTDEIALNPAHFRERPVIEVLATLAHEMVHLWQHHCGRPGRGRYHNRQWADQMKVIGLQPTATGEEGGRETGDSVHHLIISNGRFEIVAGRLLDGGFAILWTERIRMRSGQGAGSASDEGQASENKSGKRVRYVCADEACGQKAWARHDAHFLCGLHNLPMRPSR